MPRPPESKYVPALGFDWLTPYYDAVVGAKDNRAVGSDCRAGENTAAGPESPTLRAIGVERKKLLVDPTQINRPIGTDGDGTLVPH